MKTEIQLGRRNSKMLTASKVLQGYKVKITQISLGPTGAYITHLVPKVVRGMHGKSKGHVDEVLIVGVPNSRLQDWCVQNNIYITNLYVRDARTDEILLYRKDINYLEKERLNPHGIYTYVEKEKLNVKE